MSNEKSAHVWPGSWKQLSKSRIDENAGPGQCVFEDVLATTSSNTHCLVDTGCELTLVPKDLISRFTNIEVRPSIRRVWAANNTPIRIEGEVRLPFELDEKCLWTIALVSEDVEEVMLGIDWLEANNCVWDLKDWTVVYQRTTGHYFISLWLCQMSTRFSTRMSGNSASISARCNG